MQTDPNEYAGDYSQSFLIDESNIRGRLVRLNNVVDTILTRHDYPEPVSRLLGELLVVASMLSANLKEGGKLTMQVKGEGLIRFVVVDAEFGGTLRGYAELVDGAEKTLVEMDKADKTPSFHEMVGNGYLCITLDNEHNKTPYQGIVTLDGVSLAEAVQNYFSNSQQSEVKLKLGVGTIQYSGQERASWCAAGLEIQHVPLNSEEQAKRELATISEVEKDEDLWQRIALFFRTTKSHELLDPFITTKELLYRLFNEDGVWVYDPQELKVGCRCSREKIMVTLLNFTDEELADMYEDDKLSVNCQFCNQTEVISREEIVTARA